jgi:hypothetical protein
MGYDKRAKARVGYLCEVQCSGVSVGVALNSRISDLSVTGAFIDSMVTLPEGTMVRLKFSLPSVEIDCAGVVMHEMPQFGMGVRFLELTPEQQAALAEIVKAG